MVFKTAGKALVWMSFFPTWRASAFHLVDLCKALLTPPLVRKESELSEAIWAKDCMGTKPFFAMKAGGWVDQVQTLIEHSLGAYPTSHGSIGGAGFG